MTHSEAQLQENSALKAYLDSVAAEAVRGELQRLTAMTEDSRTDIVVYDTDKQPDSTGNRPVKAVIRQQTGRKARTEETATVAAQRTTKKESAAESTATTETKTKGEAEEPPGFRARFQDLLLQIITVPLALLLLWCMYKLTKRFGNGK